MYQTSMFLVEVFIFQLAKEAALKLKELSYIHAEGIAGGEAKAWTIGFKWMQMST